MREYKFYDIPALVCEKDEITTDPTQNKWQILDYEAADFKGKLLFAAEDSSPAPLTLDPGVQGRYRVYIGLITPLGDGFGGTSTGFGLLSEEAKNQFFTVRPDDCWKPLEWFEESYYGTVDLTGEKFVLSKPERQGVVKSPLNSALAWIRLVEDTEEVAKSTPCMAYHFDLDYFADDKYNSPAETLGRMRMLKDGAPEVILHEQFCAHDVKELKAYGVEAKWGKYYYDNYDEVEKAIISEAHSMGAKIYASYRLEAGGFGYFVKYLNDVYKDSWYDEHPEYRCITRDGRAINACSYAYPEVRRRVIEMILNSSSPYDGVCVFFHRGIVIAFEEPVKQMVYEKYGVDATRLPMTDPRLNEVFCHFVTLFMRELREALGDKKDINAIVFYGAEDSKNSGYDVKTWVEEGLVNGICQGLMTHYETLDGLMADDGLIDLEKYKKALTERPVVCRTFSAFDLERISNGARELMEICDGKADFRATLGWERTPLETTIAIADTHKRMGVKKFISWNTNHKAKILKRLNFEKYYVGGNAELYEPRKTNYVRTMSLAGDDISTYNIDWKG